MPGYKLEVLKLWNVKNLPIFEKIFREIFQEEDFELFSNTICDTHHNHPMPWHTDSCKAIWEINILKYLQEKLSPDPTVLPPGWIFKKSSARRKIFQKSSREEDFLNSQNWELGKFLDFVSGKYYLWFSCNFFSGVRHVFPAFSRPRKNVRIIMIPTLANIVYTVCVIVSSPH